MTAGQRALLKYWREEGIVTGKKPPRLINQDGDLMKPQTWTHFFQAMDAYNLMAFYFELDTVFVVIPIVKQKDNHD